MENISILATGFLGFWLLFLCHAAAVSLRFAAGLK
jgi:hypothetical protein